MNTLDTTVNIDIKSNNDGTYDAYIADICSSGAHYPAVSADKIGEHVADLIDTLEEATSGKSYFKSVNTVSFNKSLAENTAKIKQLYDDMQRCMQTADNIKNSIAAMIAAQPAGNETISKQFNELRRRLAVENCFDDKVSFSETIALLHDIQSSLAAMSNEKQTVWICREENGSALTADAGRVSDLCIKKTRKEAEDWVKDRITNGLANHFIIDPEFDSNTLFTQDDIFVTMMEQSDLYSSAYDIRATPCDI